MDLIAALLTDLAQTIAIGYLAYKAWHTQPAKPDAEQPTEEAKMIARAIVTHHMRGGGRQRLREHLAAKVERRRSEASK